MNESALRINLIKLKDEYENAVSEADKPHYESNHIGDRDYARLCYRFNLTDLQHKIKVTQLQLQKLQSQSLERELKDVEYDHEARQVKNELLNQSIDAEEILAKQVIHLSEQVKMLEADKAKAYTKTEAQLQIRRHNSEQRQAAIEEQRRNEKNAELVNAMKQAFREVLKEHNDSYHN